MRDFINELMISYHRYWMQYALTTQGKTAHMNAMYFHIKKRSKKQIERMERKNGIV